MITIRFRIFLALAVICYYALIFYAVKKKRLILKYALIWIFLGGAFLLFVIFPKLLVKCANLIGVYDDVNFLFMILIALLIVIAMSLTMIVSRLSESNKKLAQKLAILEEEMERMKGNG